MDVCPLCGGEAWIGVRDIATGPIVDYWRAMGYRLQDDFDPLPASLEQRQCCHCGVHWFSPSLIGPAGMYEALARNDWYYGAQKWEFREALGFLAGHRPERLLEVGCGTGEFLKQARRFCGSVHGIEFNAEAAALCRQAGLDVRELKLTDMEGSFDVIAAFQVLEHVADPGRVIERWAAHLAPGGFLVVAVPNQDGVLGSMQEEFLNLPPHHASLWGEMPLKYVAKRFGLDLIGYSREPLNMELYVTYTQSLLKRIPVRAGMVGKIIAKVASVMHRSLIPYFFENASDRLAGHTHMAIYRKSG